MRLLLTTVMLAMATLCYAQIPTLSNFNVSQRSNCSNYDSSNVQLVFSSGLDTADFLCLNRNFDTVLFSANRDTLNIINLKLDTNIVLSSRGISGNEPNYAQYADPYGWLKDELQVYIDTTSNACSNKIPIDTVRIESGARWVSGVPWYVKACGKNDTVDLDFLGPSPVILTIVDSTQQKRTFHEFSANDINVACTGNPVTIYGTCTAYGFEIEMADGCPAIQAGVLSHTGPLPYNTAFHMWLTPYNDPDTTKHVLCMGDSLHFNQGSFVPNATAVYEEYIEAPRDCDTIRQHYVRLVNPMDSAVYDTIRICAGDTAWLPDGDYTTIALSDTSVLNSNAICDSVIISAVIVNPAVFVQISDTICAGQTYFFPDGDSTNVSGVDTSIFVSSTSCDSIIETTVYFQLIQSSDTLIHQICLGDSIAVGGTFYSMDTLAMDTISGFCDTLRMHSIQVFDPLQNATQVQVSICQGDTAFFADSTFSTTATVDTSIVSGTQCDSVIITNVMVIAPVVRNLADTICQGSFYTFPDGDTSSSAAIDTSMFKSSRGCDSLVVVDLFVRPKNQTQLSVQICPGTWYVFADGDSTNQALSDTVVLKNQKGCDSVVVVDVQMKSISQNTLSARICQGSWYVFADGDSSNQATIDTVIFMNSQGCDSLLIVQLSVDSISFTQQSVEICAGTWYRFPDGDSANSMSTDTSILTSSLGCDSIVYTQLSVIQIDDSISIQGDTLIALSGYDSYQWYSCDTSGYTMLSGDTSSQYAPPISGNYLVVIEEKNCTDTSTCVAISVSPPAPIGIDEFGRKNHWTLYPNPFDQSINVTPGLENAEIRVYDLKGVLMQSFEQVNETSIDLSLPAGIYLFEIKEGNTLERIRIQKY